MKKQNVDDLPTDVWLGLPLSVAAVIPWASVILFYAFAALVRLRLGRWPVVYQDSVRLPLLIECFFAYLLVVMMWGLWIVPLVALIWIPLRFKFKATRHLLAVSVALVAGWLVEVSLIWADPWAFLEWYLD